MNFIHMFIALLVLQLGVSLEWLFTGLYRMDIISLMVGMAGLLLMVSMMLLFLLGGLLL